MKRKDLKTWFQKTPAPMSESFKQGLKTHLVHRAENLYEKPSFSFGRAFRFAFAPALLLVLIAVQIFPGQSDYLKFIAGAKEYYEEHEGEVHYIKYESHSGNEVSTVEVWRSPKGEERRTISSAGLEIPTSLTMTDEYGNLLVYDEFHGMDAVDYDTYLWRLNTATVCINIEENEDLIGQSWTRIRDGVSDGFSAHVIPKEENINVFEEVSSAFDGKDRSELIKLIDSLKDNKDMEYDKVEEDGKTYHVFTFAYRDFAMLSSSSPDLSWDDQPEKTVSIYFNADTYALEKERSVEAYDTWDMETSFELVDEAYYSVDAPEVTGLFSTEGFALSAVVDWVDRGLEGYGAGCYRNGDRVSTEEETTALQIIATQFTEEEHEFWNHPIWNAARYYLLPE